MPGLGERIRQARLKAGLSQAQLARAVGTSERNIVRWEKDQNRPRLESVVAIAEATGVDVADLMNSDDLSSDDDEESRFVLTLDEIVRLRVRQIVQDEFLAARAGAAATDATAHGLAVSAHGART